MHPEGPQAMGWFKKEISKLGVASVTLAGGEFVPALERGAIDRAEWAAV